MNMTLRDRHIALPAFFPDGTHGVVRGVDAADLASAGVAGVEMNAFHLLARPGARSIQAMGGLHAFTGWQGAILTDSGGFQLYSMLRENPQWGQVRKDRILYRTEKQKSMSFLSPEKSIQSQFQLGSDIMMCLDYCTHADEPPEKQRVAVEYTLRWAAMAREEYMRLWKGSGEPGDLGDPGDRNSQSSRPLLFAIVQGGGDIGLRRECANSLLQMGFDGYGFGGWPLDGEGRLMDDMLRTVAETVSPYPAYAMGVGRPEEIVACVQLGFCLFDCVIPTREARHHRLYIWDGDPATIALDKPFYHFHYTLDEHQRDARPVDLHCDCPCCRHYSRAYLHHLFTVGDTLAPRLATLHNLRFYTRLMERLQEDAHGASMG